jgi:AcrR family transcriptional regulator
MSTPETLTPVTPPFADKVPKCTTDSCARDRIFEAAKNLFYRYGIRGVSVDAIAAEADTTKVTLYRVFSSKDELVVEVLQDHSKRVFEWWDSVVGPFAGQPRKQLESLFTGIRDQLCRDASQRGCPVTNAAVEVVEPDHPAREVIRKHKLEVNRRLRELCAEMGAKEPQRLGDALTLLVSGIFATRLTCAGAEQLDSVHDAAMALLDSPLGVPPPKPARRR